MKGNTAMQLGLAALAMTGTLAAHAAGTAYPPLGPLPPVPVPADNLMTTEKVELGKKLFWDNRLSGDNSTPCVSCHLPQLGWGDGGEISRGYPGTKHWRNSQTVLNSAYYNKLFWEGNVTSLEAQAPSAAEGGVAGNGDRAMMEMRLRFIPEYVDAFKKVFGAEWPRMTQAYAAIAAYQRTVVTDAKKVPFDRWQAGDKTAMSESAVRGYQLFNGKAACIQCHNGPLASDQRFYSVGLPENPQFDTDPMYQITHRWEQYQKGVSEATYREADRDYGYYYVTKDPKDKGKFRTPSLRELKYTAPYMHNGILATLDAVVDFYDAGGGPLPGKSDKLKPLGLTADEKKDLVAFLEALSMTEPLIHDAPTLPADYEPLPAPKN
ncbi:MAG TPA: cytochrome c peroxidase [Rhodocyclaceae bacterium]|nr:cytochrome c peroxidase [Rhodocyclaceae bacterium]